MTVKELIAKLQTLPQDMPVAVCDNEVGWVELTWVSNTDKFPLADYSPIVDTQAGVPFTGHYVQLS